MSLPGIELQAPSMYLFFIEWINSLETATFKHLSLYSGRIEDVSNAFYKYDRNMPGYCRPSVTMNQQWTDIYYNLQVSAAGCRLEGVRDRCVAIAANDNRSIDIVMLSHVNIKLFRYVSRDIKRRIFFGNIAKNEETVCVKRRTQNFKEFRCHMSVERAVIIVLYFISYYDLYSASVTIALSFQEARKCQGMLTTQPGRSANNGVEFVQSSKIGVQLVLSNWMTTLEVKVFVN